MGIPANMTRTELVGHLGTGEIFNTGFWMDQGLTDDETANAWCAYVATQLTGPTLTALCHLLNADSGYDEVRAYSYIDGGPHATSVGSAPIDAGAGTSGNITAMQISLCVTLRTGLSGRTKRGRMYLPADGAIIDVGHLFTAAQVDDAVSGLAGFFQALNIHDDPGFVCVLSQKLSTFARVTELTADRRPDIQRRRADRQPAVISSVHAV